MDKPTLVAGESASFDVVVANPNDESKPISLVPVENTWADVEISPSLKMVEGGKDAVFKVTVTPRESVQGEKVMNILVKEGANSIGELTVDTYVEGDGEDNVFNYVIAGLLIVAIIVLFALVIAVARKKNDDGDEDLGSSEEYY
jgi:hypothetical protein